MRRLCKAFTMAEILLSLTIIGVVAAITLPSLTGNINERTWNTQRKALYARMSQAVSLMPSLNGYGKFTAASGTEGSDSYVAGEDTAAETFITDGLSKVLKINNVCDSEHLADCGLANKYISIDGTVTRKLEDMKTLFEYAPVFDGQTIGQIYDNQMLNTKAAALETQNGESILVFYNPQCISSRNIHGGFWDYSQHYMCANFVYDLNGSKGPNTVGKDVGVMSAIYPVDPIVAAPVPLSKDANVRNSIDNYGVLCREIDDNTRIPDIYEVMSMFYNYQLVNMTMSQEALSGTRDTVANSYRILSTSSGSIGIGSSGAVRCMKR